MANEQINVEGLREVVCPAGVRVFISSEGIGDSDVAESTSYFLGMASNMIEVIGETHHLIGSEAREKFGLQDIQIPRSALQAAYACEFLLSAAHVCAQITIKRVMEADARERALAQSLDQAIAELERANANAPLRSRSKAA